MSISEKKGVESPKSPKNNVSTSGNGKGRGAAIEFNYNKLNASNFYISVPSGHTPYFDGTHYAA